MSEKKSASERMSERQRRAEYDLKVLARYRRITLRAWMKQSRDARARQVAANVKRRIEQEALSQADPVSPHSSVS